jgi:four helix bundle protein
MEQINNKYKKIASFTDLIVWQEGHKLVVLIYTLTKTFPKEEKYSLVDQMRRAATSVTSNIAEGFGRQTYKEKVQFYYQAKGSLTELKNQIFIAKDINYLNQDQIVWLMKQSNCVDQLLQGLIKKSKTFINRKSSIINHGKA